MDLNSALLEEEEELKRLEALIPADEGEYDEEDIGEYQEEGEPEEGLQADGYEEQ